MPNFDILTKAFTFLNSLPDPVLNIVDVGCCVADFRHLPSDLYTKNIFWVGIDPLDFGVAGQYDIFIKKAITNVVEESVVDFYVNKITGVSSLSKMKEITRNKDEYDDKWYEPAEIEIIKEITKVTACSLQSIIDSIPALKIVHFLKIDTEGSDIKVVESLGQAIKNVYFIQLECVVSKNETVVLYENQTHFNYDVKRMEELGFDVYDMSKINRDISPLVDVIFYNKELVI